MTADPSRVATAIRGAVAKKVSARLEAGGMSRFDLADALDVSDAKAARFLKGSSSLTVEQLVITSRLLGCQAQDLLPSI